MLAGSALALGLWNLFNLLFVGGALTAIDPDEIDRAHAMGIGTGIGSVLAPLIAMFIGGLVAGRIASHYDRRVSAGHGALVWAITSILGIVIMANVADSFLDKRPMRGHGPDGHPGMMMMGNAPAPGTKDFIDDRVKFVNEALKSKNAPTIDTEDFLDASLHAARNGTVNTTAFIARLDEETKLSRPEAEAALAALGDTAPDAIIAGHQLATHRQQAMEAAEDTGNVMLAAGVAFFLCLATAIAGALIGGRAFSKHHPGIRHETVPGHTTAPYPVTPAPTNASASNVMDPNVRRDPLE